MKEVCAGNGFENAAKDLGINAERTFKGDAYEVWKLDDDALDQLQDIPEGDWKDDWGWVRWNDGCNLEDHEPYALFKIGDFKILAWFSEDRLNRDIELWCDDDSAEERSRVLKGFFTQQFCGLCDYCIQMWGASMVTNVTAITTGLAKLNDMTLSELWQKCGE